MITLYVGESALNSLLVYIVSIIYHFVAQIMKLFVVLSETEILDSSVYMQLVKNFYLILGVGMLFVIAFSLLKVMVDPESSKGTEETTGIIKKFITSILLLIFLPTIFSFAFSFQSAVVRQGTIGKIFGNNVAVTSDDLKSVGATMANSVFLPFFQPTEEFVENECNGVNDNECLKKIKAPNYIFKTALNDSSNLYETIEAVNSGKLSFAAYADYGDSIKEGDVSFNFILSLFCGIFMIYVVFSFCLDLGLRYVKLLFYQVIAPIPLFFRIVPNSKISDTFNQWVKVTITCYLEVFIRLFVIYFGVWLCGVLLNEDNGIFRSNFASGDGAVSLFANLVIVLSILTFMKQAPKLIGEAFGFDSSNIKLGLSEKLGGLFAAGGAVGSLIASKGNPLAAIRGWKNGIGNIGAEAKRRKEYKDARSAGVTKRQMMMDYMLSKAGFGSQADIQKSKVEDEDYEVSNESAKDITYQKPNGEKVTIGKGEKNKKINAGDIESMEAEKAKNISKISAHRDRIKNLEQEAASGSARIQHKSDLKSEAEKKIDEAGSTVMGEFTYYEPDVNGNIEFNSDGELIAGTQKKFTGTYEQIKHFKMNNLSARQIETAQSDESIRDKMIADYIIEESKKAGSKIARDMYSGFKSIQYNKGYEFYTYEYEVDEEGKIKTDKNGKEITKKDDKGEVIIRKISFNVEQDENGAWRVDRKSLVDENGIELSEQSIKDFGLIGIEKSDYDLIKKIDKIAKTSNGIIENKKQFIQETEINTIQAQNDAIDAIKQQFNDAKDAAMRTSEMRQREISSKYIANRNSDNK